MNSIARMNVRRFGDTDDQEPQKQFCTAVRAIYATRKVATPIPSNTSLPEASRAKQHIAQAGHTSLATGCFTFVGADGAPYLCG